MKILKILLLCLFAQGAPVQATFIATWTGHLFLRVVHGVVVVTNQKTEATQFVIKNLSEQGQNRTIVTNEEQTNYLFFDRLTARVCFGCVRYGNILLSSPIPDTPFHTISLGSAKNEQWLRLGIDGELELSDFCLSGRTWWKFINE